MLSVGMRVLIVRSEGADPPTPLVGSLGTITGISRSPGSPYPYLIRLDHPSYPIAFTEAELEPLEQLGPRPYHLQED